LLRRGGHGILAAMPARTFSSVLCGVLLAVLTTSFPASGQDDAASEALFNKGLADMMAKRYESACLTLAESYRLGPRTGTLFTLAECEAGWGKLASAVTHYSEYVAQVSRLPAADRQRHLTRQKGAQAQIEKLRPRVPSLTLRLPPDAPRGVVVKRGGVELSSAALGVALPIDAGEHELSTQVPGGTEHLQKISLAPGESREIVLHIELPPPPPGASSSAAVPTQTSPPPPPPPPPSSPSRTPAYVALGVGATGIVVGAIAGVLALQRKSIVDQECSGNRCSSAGKDAADSGKTFGTVSTVGFGVGLAGLGAGLILWLTSPDPPATAATWRLRPTLASRDRSSLVLGVDGSW
jgi:hypothetical protein